MKELSTEEKAKRYDEALERAKLSRLQLLNIGEEATEIEYIFPELKESDDERIRKDIISFVEQAIDAGYGIISKERKEKWIAWLEKQGRLMKALQISNARIGELIEKNYCLKEQFEKQREYDMGISEATKQKLEDSLNKALEKETPESFNEFLDGQGEQKPKRMVSAEAKEAMYDKPAWSEEDESLRLRTIGALETCKIGSPTKCVDEQINWLKSLKDRYTWKPSDEQMAVLNEVINYAANSELQHWSSFIYTLLKSLREQLKKLKG